MSKLKRTISLLLLVCLLGACASAAAFAEDVLVWQSGGFVIQQSETQQTQETVVTTQNTEQQKTEQAAGTADSSQIPGVSLTSSGCAHTLNSDTGRCSSCGELIVAVNDKGAYYTSVQDALNNGGTVRLLCDVIPSVASTLLISKNLTVVLDLNGKKLGGGDSSVQVDIENYGHFTLTDSQENTGELFGSIYTKGYEIKEYTEGDSYIITDYAYGATAIISGGKIFGDVVVCHDADHPYHASAEKPNPSLTINGGIFVGGTVCLLDENQGSITISGGQYLVEPPAKYIVNGYEAKKDGDYYHIVGKEYYAGWTEPSFTAGAGMTEHAKSVVTNNRAAGSFAAGDMDLINVSALMISNGVAFNPDTDALKCALQFSCSDAAVYGSGDGEKVTGLRFTVSPLLYVFHGGESMNLGIGWDQVVDDTMTVRLPVDSNLSCSAVNVFVGEAMAAKYMLEVQTDGNGDRFVQACFSSTELAAGLRYEAVIRDNCTIIYEGNGGTFNADGNILTSVTSSVKGGEDLTLRENCFTREHYSFSGWSCSGRTYAEKSLVNFITDDMIFSAVWTPEKYSISYELGGGENSLMNISAYEYDSTFTLSAPERADAVFAGWYDNADFAGEPVTGLVPGDTGDKVFYAKWNVTVTITTSGDGTGTIADSSRSYVSGDQVELPMGGNFSVNIFHAEGSYISAVKVNGEEYEVTSLLALENLAENTTVEIVFTAAAAMDSTQAVDLSDAKAEDGSSLSSATLSRVEDAFQNDIVTEFEDSTAIDAIDLNAAKAIFAEQTGQEIGEHDEVTVQVQMQVSTVYTNGTRIDGYKIDAKPVMTVIAAEGTIKGKITVPNEAITGAITMRIPIDSLAYMDNVAVYHEGVLLGYETIQGSSPERYADVAATSFSEYTVVVVDGVTNHPAAAIGTTGYETVADALASAVPGDTVYILRDDAAIPVADAALNGDSMTLEEALNICKEGDLLICGNTYSVLGNKPIALTVQPPLVGSGNAPVLTVTYIGNGGTAGGKTEIQITDETDVLDNSDTRLGFTNSASGAGFIVWNTQPDGRGIPYYPYTTVEENITLYAIWYAASVYDESGNLVGSYPSLESAYNAAKPRQQIVLLKNIYENNVTIGKELLLDLNGYDWEKNGISFVMGDDKKIFYSSPISPIGYDLEGHTYSKYQFRTAYTIVYDVGQSSSATITKPTSPTEGTTTYLTEDTKVTNASKSRYNGVDASAKSASFAGWYLNPQLVADSTRLVINGTVSETSVSVTNCTLKAVDAPAWPTESAENTTITLYPRWMWSIIAAFNNYGYVMCNDTRITSSTPYYFDEGTKPLLKFVPNDGYHVYRVTIKGYNAQEVFKGEIYEYTPSWYEDFKDEKGVTDHGLQISQTIVVTFARGYYNPTTGDTGRTGLWITLMGLSMIIMGTVTLKMKKRKEEN